MKKQLLYASALLSFCFAQAQIYSDAFDDNLTTASTSFYDVSLTNGNLVIAGNGDATAYQSVAYQTHQNGTTTNIDITSGLTLYIKVKATGLPDLRIDLRDANSYDTNFPSQAQKITADFEIYQFDYSQNLKNAYNDANGCTVDTPCDVDASAIKELLFYANDAVGGYDGTIEIDWISFGEPLEALPEASEFQIRYNQLGYTLDQPKTISIVASSGQFSNKSYEIFDSANNSLISGTTGAASLWTDANEYVANINITTINTAGSYRFVIDEEEVTFTVDEDVYANLREEAFKYYYYNRASTALTQQYAGAYARPAGLLDDQVYVHKSAASSARPEGFEIAAPKGWFDAGDYNKYIVNSGISTYTLLAAFEHYQDYFGNTNFSIPEEGGALPDILDEAKWNLDWMLAMQDPNDGGVYHKLTGLNFSGNVMPATYAYTISAGSSPMTERYVVKKTTSAALDFAAVMAVASRVFEAYDPNYSAQMISAAEEAYEWAQNNREEFYFQPNQSNQGEGNPLLDDVFTGEYRDDNFTDEFQWAAVEMYITTGENTYANDFNAAAIDGGIPGWQNVATLALLSIAHHSANLPSAITTAANANLLAIADDLATKINTSAMNVAMAGNDFVWGSNGVAGNQIVLLLNAYQLTADEAYLEAAYTGIDYLFGRNGTGYSFITGFGDLTPIDPHHRISAYDGIGTPVPGMIVGGPHYPEDALGGECSISDYPSMEQAKSYYDGYCSYSRNEVTINWNAPLVYALHAMRAIQTGQDSTLSNPDYQAEFIANYEVYPNPAANDLHIESLKGTTGATISVYTLAGKKVISETLSKPESILNIADLASGIYLIKLEVANDSYVTKVVKQ